MKMPSSHSRPEQLAPFGSPPKPPPPTWQRLSSKYSGDSSRPQQPARKPKPDDYRSLPAFEYVNLTKLERSNPSAYAAVTSTAGISPSKNSTKSSKQTKPSMKPTKPEPTSEPVGYLPQPAMSSGHPQHLCPICSTPIGHGEGQNFTGNLPCKHRGPCNSRLCILAYYGSLNRWALPYTGSNWKPVFCRAPGCGAQIEAWCQVQCQENKTSSVGQIVHNNSYRDPKVVKAEEERRWKVLERERREGGDRSWPSELRGNRDKWRDRAKTAACVCCCWPCICCAELSKELCYDFCLGVALCCSGRLG